MMVLSSSMGMLRTGTPATLRIPAAAPSQLQSCHTPTCHQLQRHPLCRASSAAAAGVPPPEGGVRGAAPSASQAAADSDHQAHAAASTSGKEGTQPLPASTGIVARLRCFFTGDKAVTRAKLAELGLGAFAAYGIVSNLNAGVLMAISWLSIVKRFGCSPLEQGLWPQFLLTYAGLYVGSNFLRPIRLSAALAAAPLINRFLEALQRRTGANKVLAFALLLALIAAGSFTIIFGVITALGGFPNGLPPMPWQQAAAT